MLIIAGDLQMGEKLTQYYGIIRKVAIATTFHHAIARHEAIANCTEVLA